MAMTSLHAAVGVAIARAIPNPFISLPLAFISHSFLDYYPEWYPKISGVKKKDEFKLSSYGLRDYFLFIVQFLLCVSVLLYCIKESNWIYFAAAFLANLMDVWDAIYQKIFGKTFWFQHGGDFPFRLKGSWQSGGMKPEANAVLDMMLVVLVLL